MSAFPSRPKILVHPRRLELPPLAGHGPQPCVSASSTTGAYLKLGARGGIRTRKICLLRTARLPITPPERWCPSGDSNPENLRSKRSGYANSPRRALLLYKTTCPRTLRVSTNKISGAERETRTLIERLARWVLNPVCLPIPPVRHKKLGGVDRIRTCHVGNRRLGYSQVARHSAIHSI